MINEMERQNYSVAQPAQLSHFSCKQYLTFQLILFHIKFIDKNNKIRSYTLYQVPFIFTYWIFIKRVTLI